MLEINGHRVEVTSFPAGEPLIRFNPEYLNPEKNVFKWLYDGDFNELFCLQCVVDFAKYTHQQFNNILVLPYVPNARMDRVENDDEANTLQTFASLINMAGFRQVITLDVHSNVSKTVIRACKDLEPTEFATIAKERFFSSTAPENQVIFFPDAGAEKRYAKLARKLNTPYIIGDKKRDWKTGQLEGLTIKFPGKTEFSLEGKDVLIIDDICCKGGTFYFGAMELKKLGVNRVGLYVSHLEKAVWQGDMLYSGLITDVYATDSIYRPSDEDEDDFVKYMRGRLGVLATNGLININTSAIPAMTREQLKSYLKPANIHIFDHRLNSALDPKVGA